MGYLRKALRTIGIPTSASSHQIPWRWSLYFHNMWSWLLLRIYRSSIILHGMIRLSHHLWWKLCTSCIRFLLGESVSIASLILDVCIWSSLRLLWVRHFPFILLLLLVHWYIVASLLRVWYVSVTCAAHCSLVDHQLDVLSLRVKSSIDERLSWVVVWAVIVLWNKLSNILGRWWTSQERLW